MTIFFWLNLANSMIYITVSAFTQWLQVIMVIDDFFEHLTHDSILHEGNSGLCGLLLFKNCKKIWTGIRRWHILPTSEQSINRRENKTNNTHTENGWLLTSFSCWSSPKLLALTGWRGVAGTCGYNIFCCLFETVENAMWKVHAEGAKTDGSPSSLTFFSTWVLWVPAAPFSFFITNPPLSLHFCVCLGMCYLLVVMLLFRNWRGFDWIPRLISSLTG